MRVRDPNSGAGLSLVTATRGHDQTDSRGRQALLVEFDRYAKFYDQASARTRSVYIVIAAFTVMGLAAVVNTLPEGWAACRLAAAQRTVAYYRHHAQPSSPSDFSAANLERGREFATVAHISTLAEASAAQAAAQREIDQVNTVSVPLFGVTFDVNDLGLVAGLGLLVLMALLKYALIREHDNLVLAWRKAKSLDIVPEAFEILGTSEVLHRPDCSTYCPPGPLCRPVFDGPLCLLILPVILYVLIMANDVRTYGNGLMLSPVHTYVMIAFEAVTSALLVWIAYGCRIQTSECNRLWLEMRNAWRRIPVNCIAVGASERRPGDA